MLQKDIKKALKKAGVVMSEAVTSSRVKGWVSSVSKGWDFEGLYPWVSRYTRKGHSLKSYIQDRTQEVSLNFSAGFTSSGSRDVSPEYRTEQFNLVRTTLTNLKIQFTETDNGFEIMIDNPYSEEQVEKAQSRWDMVMRSR